METLKQPGREFPATPVTLSSLCKSQPPPPRASGSWHVLLPLPEPPLLTGASSQHPSPGCTPPPPAPALPTRQAGRSLCRRSLEHLTCPFVAPLKIVIIRVIIGSISIFLSPQNPSPWDAAGGRWKEVCYSTVLPQRESELLPGAWGSRVLLTAPGSSVFSLCGSEGLTALCVQVTGEGGPPWLTPTSIRQALLGRPSQGLESSRPSRWADTTGCVRSRSDPFTDHAQEGLGLVGAF